MRQGGASYSLGALLGAIDKTTGDVKTRVKNQRGPSTFDKDGNELVDFDHDAEAPLGDVTCDKCKQDTWYESFKVGKREYCPRCLSEKVKLTDAQRRAAQRQVFGEDAPCA